MKCEDRRPGDAQNSRLFHRLLKHSAPLYCRQVPAAQDLELLSTALTCWGTWELQLQTACLSIDKVDVDDVDVVKVALDSSDLGTGELQLQMACSACAGVTSNVHCVAPTSSCLELLRR